jgi:hypothetical protein
MLEALAGELAAFLAVRLQWSRGASEPVDLGAQLVDHAISRAASSA